MIEMVDVHKASITSLEPRLEEYISYLSGDEYLRASRFKRKSDQKKFILIRGHLRWLLSRKIGESPSEIQFVYGLNRKPQLPSNRCYFNVSHSKQTFLIAISPSTPVGVDIEEYRNVHGVDHPIFFHQDERAYLQQLKSSEKQMGMLWLWTRKEALCKATGEGLTTDLSDTSLLQDEIEYKGQSYKFFSKISDRDVYSLCIRTSGSDVSVKILAAI